MGNYAITAKASLIAVTLLLAIPSAEVQAQETLEEIIVFAQKREQNVQDVGIAMSVLSGDQLRILNLTSSESLGDHVPGLYVTSYSVSPNLTYFALRGVSQNDFADHHEGPVAIYVDGAYNSFIGGIGVEMFDVDRVEVLKGPQGTLFGRNATGGLVHLLSKRPSDEADGYVDLQIGDFDQIRVEGAFGGPLGDNVNGRLAFVHNQHDGWITNLVGEDLGETNNVSFRGQLELAASENTSVLLNVRGSADDTIGAGYVIRGPVAADPVTGLDVFVPSGSAEHINNCFSFIFFAAPPTGSSDCVTPVPITDAYTGRFQLFKNLPHEFKRDYLGATVTITSNQESFNFTSVTDFQTIEKSYLEIDGPPELLGSDFFTDQDADQFSQEIRFDGGTDTVQWQAGVYYLNIDGEYIAGILNPIGFYVDITNPYTLETKSYAVFAQGEFSLTDKLTLIAGARYTKDEKDYVFNLNGECIEDPSNFFGFDPFPCGAFFGFGGFFGPTDVQVTGFVGSQDESDWSGRLGLNYNPNDDVLLYGSISRANKAGDFNAPLGLKGGPEIMPYDQEVLTALEFGIKSTLFGGSARLNVAAFYYDYEDYQAFSFQGVSALVFNTDAEVKGAELEFASIPAEGWELALGVAWLDSTAKDITLPSGIVRDQVTPNSPEWTYNGLIRKDWNIGNGGALYLQGDFSYVSEQTSSVINHPVLKFDAYTIGNVKAGYVANDGQWEVALFVQNVLDEEYFTYGFQSGAFHGGVNVTPGKPQWWGASFRYNWQ